MKKGFSSKVLLFGEYSVILNSKALAMPYSLFEGHFTFGANSPSSPTHKDPELAALSRYLQKCYENGELNFPFDTTAFSFDVGQGLSFESTIPQGYGVGSSGALVAALYDRYSESDTLEISELKKRFALIESHFHGSSSGFDPLISYLNRPILNAKDGTLKPIDLKKREESNWSLFLLNTGRSRKTEPLVNLFLEKCKSEEFSYLCQESLQPITDQCIDNFLSGKKEELWDSFRALSQFQYENFKPMIPKLYYEVWEQGLSEQNFLLKLCGAGGGGFLLGMTRDYKQLRKTLGQYEIRRLINL